MKRFFLALMIIPALLYASASEKEHTCSGHYVFGLSSVPTHVSDSALLDYDVIFYGIDLEVNDRST